MSRMILFMLVVQWRALKHLGIPVMKYSSTFIQLGLR